MDSHTVPYYDTDLSSSVRARSKYPVCWAVYSAVAIGLCWPADRRDQRALPLVRWSVRRGGLTNPAYGRHARGANRTSCCIRSSTRSYPRCCLQRSTASDPASWNASLAHWGSESCSWQLSPNNSANRPRFAPAVPVCPPHRWAEIHNVGVLKTPHWQRGAETRQLYA